MTRPSAPAGASAASSASRLWVTPNAGAYVYDKATRRFDAAPGGADRPFVKGIGSQPSGQVVTSRPNPNCSVNAWCTRSVEMFGPDVTRTRANVAFYKARVWSPYYAVPPSAPVNRWTADDGAGPELSNSTGGPLAVVHGGATRTAGRTGEAVRFDGSTGYAETGAPAVDPAGSFTVGAWVRPTTVQLPDSNWATAVSQNGVDTSAFTLALTPGGRWAFSMHATDAAAPTTHRVYSGTPASATGWTHLAGTYDAGTRQMRLYVDGVIAATGDGVGSYRAQGAFVLGRARWDGGWSGYWPGDVDDVQTWDRALDPTGVAALVAGG